MEVVFEDSPERALTLKREPDAGWADAEAGRIAPAGAGAVWVLMSRLVGGETALLRELVAALDNAEGRSETSVHRSTAMPSATDRLRASAGYSRKEMCRP